MYGVVTEASAVKHPKDKKRHLDEIMAPLCRAVELRIDAVLEMANALLDIDDEHDRETWGKLVQEHGHLVLATHGSRSYQWVSHLMLQARYGLRLEQVDDAAAKFRDAGILAQELGLHDRVKVCAISIIALSLSKKKQRTDQGGDEDGDGGGNQDTAAE